MRHIFFSLLLSTSFIVVGCTSTPIESDTPLPQLSFAQLQSVPVNVSRIDFTSQARHGAAMWDMANDLPTPPDTAMTRYLDKRFRANGSNGVLSVNLQQAQITSEDVPNENFFLAYTGLADVSEYTFDVIVEMESKYVVGQPNTKLVKRFARKVRMPVNATVAYREARLQRTLEEIMRDIDDSLLQSLSRSFGLVAVADLPAKNMPVDTQLPEIETNVGVHWQEFKDDVSETADQIEGTFNEGGPQSITPRAVESEPLNN